MVRFLGSGSRAELIVNEIFGVLNKKRMGLFKHKVQL